MSYQCDVRQLHATNRVIGGSPGKPEAASKPTPARGRRASPSTRRRVRVTGGSPASARTRLMNSHSSTGSPLRDEVRLARATARRRRAGRRRAGAHRRRCRCRSRPPSTGREPMRRSFPAARLRSDARDQVRVARPPDQVRPQRRPSPGPVRSPRAPPARRSPSSRGSARRSAWDTAVDSFAPLDVAAAVNDARRAGVDEPADAVLLARGEDVLGAGDVRGEEVGVAAPDAGLRGDVEDDVAPRRPPLDRLRVARGRRATCSTPSSSSHG